MPHPQIREQLNHFYAIIKDLDALYSSFARSAGLSDSTFWILYYLWEETDECTQHSICEKWALSKQTVNNAIKDLERDGLIELTESTKDKRRKRISFTLKGVEFCETHVGRVYRIDQKIFEEMTEEERDSLIRSNAKYLDMLRAAIQT